MDGPTSEVNYEGNKEDPDDQESFICQRVRVYIRKEHVSCARTYMPWPFSNTGSSGSVPFTPDHLSSSPATTPPLLPLISHDESSKDHCDRDDRWFEIRLNGISTNVKHPPSKGAAWFSCNSQELINGGNRDEKQDEAKDEVEQGNGQVPPHPKQTAASTSAVETGPCSALGSDGDDGGPSTDERPQSSAGVQGLCSLDMEGREMDRAKAESAGDVWDEIAAYEQDVLLVSVTTDSELFENLPEANAAKQSLPQFQNNASDGSDQRVIPALTQDDSADMEVCQSDREDFWLQRDNIYPATEKQIQCVDQLDGNNNHVNEDLERNQLIQALNVQPSNDAGTVDSVSAAELRHQKYNGYCRQFFSESMSCGYRVCWFRHVPMDGDEKFCIDTVIRFTKNLFCLQKAASVFTGYYQNNTPGECFSQPVLHSLLWALLKANMMTEVLSVLAVALTHRIVPEHEFLLALFNLVREKSLMWFIPELLQLVVKMVSAGLILGPDCLNCVKNTPSVLSSSAPLLHDLTVTHSILEVELCTKSKEWKQMGLVLKSICQSSQRLAQVEHISTRIAMSLLSDGKDKLSLPFADLAETVCLNETTDSRSMTFFGRIGVSLMLRYHKTHQWAKGRMVVETLCNSKVEYSTLKSLFGSDGGVSRGHLVTIATELFLWSGSVEGALNTLREKNWFLCSWQWPCELADVESRIHVLMRLAEKSSPRDVLDILRNLPGLKETCDLVDISRFTPLLNSQLQVFLDKNVLPLATDTVNLMHCKKLAVDPAMLQMLLYKLGKQNLWLQARQVFRQSLKAGYYQGVCAPSSLMTLTVPCQLGEMELALTLELFITVNAAVILHLPETTPRCLTVVLKRSISTEMDYLSASNRLMSAALMAQPQLTLRYTAVNSMQEQMFTLDISTAQCWLRHNHFWACKLWTQ